MAGGSVRDHLDDQGVPIAVRRDGNDMLVIPAGFALQPKLLPAPAPEAPKGPTQEELLAEIRDLLKQK